jgi:hypothetical protein
MREPKEIRKKLLRVMASWKLDFLRRKRGIELDPVPFLDIWEGYVCSFLFFYHVQFGLQVKERQNFCRPCGR